jgi:hypothetical protein
MSEVKEKSQLLVERGPYSKREETVPATQSQPANLMQALAVAAANPAMDVAKVKELFAMHKELQDREAAQAFADALARAQAGIQPIAKDRRNEHTKSWYATLAAIVDEITPVYTAEGLSVSFDTYDTVRDKDLPPLDQGKVRVIGFLSHRGGHTRKYHLDGALDDAGKDGTKNKTGIQAMGSTVSYLRRYLVCMMFNVATADDNDGNGGKGGGEQRLTDKQLADHLAAMDGCANEADMLAAFAKAYNACEELKDKDSQRVLLAKRDELRKKLKARR